MLEINYIKIPLTIFLILITGFLLGLVLLWYVPLRKIMFFNVVQNLKDTTHVYLKSEGGDT